MSKRRDARRARLVRNAAVAGLSDMADSPAIEKQPGVKSCEHIRISVDSDRTPNGGSVTEFTCRDCGHTWSQHT